MSVNLWKTLASIQLSTASLSFVSSMATAVMITRSQSPFTSSPYHRIIFGLSVSDMFQSFAMSTGPFAAPASVPQALWGIGNSQTCTANGFFMTMGTTATPMYILMLCLYCLFNIKKTSASQDGFPKKLEWAMHIFIVTSNLALSIAGLMTKSINSLVTGTACGFAAYPTGCRQRPEIFGECDEASSRYIVVLTSISWIGVSLACLLGIVISMSMICWYVARTTMMFTRSGRDEHVERTKSTLRNKNSVNRSLKIDGDGIGDKSGGYTSLSVEDSLNLSSRKDEPPTLQQGIQPILTSTSQRDPCINVNEKRSNENHHNVLHHHESERVYSSDCEDLKSDDKDEEVSEHKTDKFSTENPDVSSASLATEHVDPEVVLRAKSREIMIQACLFVLAFFATYICWWAVNILLMNEKQPPVFLMYGVMFFYPLGGFFNILVYSRPKVKSFMRQHGGQYSWLRAFFLVIRAGILVPTVNGHTASKKSSEASAHPTGEEIEGGFYIESNVQCDYGGSQSFGDDHIAYRQKHEWSCQMGGSVQFKSKDSAENDLGDVGCDHSENALIIGTKRNPKNDPLARAYARAYGRVEELKINHSSIESAESNAAV